MHLACPDLFSRFEKNATLVTPSHLLAEAAAEQYSQSCIRQGLDAWERPGIYSIGAWLTMCWHEARYGAQPIPTLLSFAQEAALWHSIIEEERLDLFDVSATVRLAARASTLLAEWQIRADGEFWSDHADARQFQKWLRLFRRKCQEKGWITHADLRRLVPEWIAAGSVCPGPTLFVGFEPATPSFRAVQLALGDLASVVPFAVREPRPSAAAKRFDDCKAELEFAARAARTLFEENPACTIAIFVPGLAQQYAAVERVLTRVFYPSSTMRFARMPGVRVSPADGIFHIPAGPPLAGHPLVAGALLLLELAKPRIAQADACAILRHPFVSGAKDERSARALADLALRKRRELDVSLGDLESAAWNCPKLQAVWRSLRRLLNKKRPEQEMPQWSEFIADLLSAAGWPGDEPLTDSEQNIVEAWNDRLSDLSAVGLVCQPVAFDAALAHLRRLLSNATGKGSWLSPIHVLDSSDARGLEFEHAIVTGLSDETWPPPDSLSPLVPLKMQRVQSARDERKLRTRALFASAPHVIATCTGRISPLAEPFVKRKAVEIAHWNGRLPEQSFLKATLDEAADSAAPRLTQSDELRGGTGIIKAQSQCPFRAFAEYRLRAKAPEDASFGFDSLERGSFMHKALENVWRRLQSQDCLRRTSAANLRTLVREAIAEAVNTPEIGPLHQLAVRAERERLEDLILDWLELERNRKEPFTVETVEEERFYEVPGLRLALRVDRIDRLRNGGLVLIDYKSGPQSRPKLLGERPPEPQLLVYAASLGSQVEGVFFGQLRPRDVRAVGFSRRKQFPLPTAEEKKDWDDYIEQARDNVEKLALDFVRGEAAVNPIKDACNFCCVKPLCRVNAAGVIPEDQE